MLVQRNPEKCSTTRSYFPCFFLYLLVIDRVVTSTTSLFKCFVLLFLSLVFKPFKTFFFKSETGSLLILVCPAMLFHLPLINNYICSMLCVQVFAHMYTCRKWFWVSVFSSVHSLSLGISHPDYFLCWGDH